ncbi:DMT family transporter [Actibacterium sp. 188UL27-1]|uniref:DMT family transporter n=1 Tax=Actibacterium sp. 188UL27-1 TaxID=2786961 RepID=UPI0019573A6D|nr:DMT family transporter [Actibacterium sp. 188UL27-1]MBM7068816.1 DMT family transporter [Actibacterium sp. 188UL27-1]
MDTSGITLRIGATFFFTLMVICAKLLADTVPVGQVVFFRSAVALIPLIGFLIWTREFPQGLRTRRPMAHVLRCMLGCTALFASFASLKYLPLADATIIGYLAPLVSVVLARLVLGEDVPPARWLAVTVGFLGILVLVIPQLNDVDLDRAYLIGAALALTMALFTAGAKIQIRSLALTENAGAIAFYFALTCALAGLATASFGWIRPDGYQLALLIGAGMAGGIAHIMMTLALQRAEVSKLAPFEYLALLFAIIADVAVFGLAPQMEFYYATALILGSLWLVTKRAKRIRPTTI